MVNLFYQDNIILIDKPKGISSFDVIRILRRKMNLTSKSKEWKMGHAGTLDPLASGLILVGVADGTKKLSELIGLPKEYEATIRLGVKTESGDLDGKVIEEMPVEVFCREKLEKTLHSMLGEHHIKPPMYSAIKKDGKPLYEYAREGKTVEVPVKVMIVNSAELISFEGNEVKVKFGVSSGTYIRSLGELFAEKLGTVGTLSDLRRTRIGEYKIENAEKL
jgi:tRNA pseudouridine55 synthase